MLSSNLLRLIKLVAFKQTVNKILNVVHVMNLEFSLLYKLLNICNFIISLLKSIFCLFSETVVFFYIIFNAKYTITIAVIRVQIITNQKYFKNLFSVKINNNNLLIIKHYLVCHRLQCKHNNIMPKHVCFSFV